MGQSLGGSGCLGVTGHMRTPEGAHGTSVEEFESRTGMLILKFIKILRVMISIDRSYGTRRLVLGAGLGKFVDTGMP